MKIRIELTEVLFILSCVMFLNGAAAIGWTFFGLANVVGICKFGITQAEKIEEVKQKAKLEQEIKSLIGDQKLSDISDVYPKLVH